MPDIGRSSSSSSFEAKESVAEKTRSQQKDALRAPNGDIIGSGYIVPKGDFGMVMGYKPPTPQEQNGQAQPNGSRVIELALQKEMTALGEGAVKNGEAYKNIHISWGRFNNEPGREKDMIKDGLDAIRQGAEKNTIEDHVGRMGPNSVKPYFEQIAKFQTESRNDNIKYLEMQYKFMEMSKQEGTISNLMKTRHDAVVRSIRGSQG